MTYIVKAPRRMAVPYRLLPTSKPLAMGDMFNLFGTDDPADSTIGEYYAGLASNANFQDQMSCIDAANGSATVSAIDAKLLNLAATWNPTGVFKPADVNTIVQAVIAQMMGAKTVVLVAPASTSDQLDVRMQAVDDIDKMYADGARFSQAATTATASNGVVNAPDLKDYVIRGLQAASNAYVTASVLSCNVSWLQSVDDGLNAVGAILMQIGGVVASAVQTVVDVAASTFATADFLAKYSGPLILAGGALLAYWYMKKKGIL